MVFPTVYAAFLAALALVAPASPMSLPAAGLAVFAALMDYGENIRLLAILARWPDFDDRLARLASGFTIGKNMAIVVTVAMLVGLWAGFP